MALIDLSKCFSIVSYISCVIGQFPTGLALAIEKKSRRIEISLYCPSRAIESFFTCMDNVRYLPKSMNLKRADMKGLNPSRGAIVGANSSLQSWLLFSAGLGTSKNTFKMEIQESICGNIPENSKIRRLRCRFQKMIHGNQACGPYVFTFFREAYKRSLPVYHSVYLIPTLLVHRQGLLKRPYTILEKSLLGTARSSLFLSVFTSSAWMWTCTVNRLFRKCDIPIVALGTFPTCLTLAVEKKSRRIEISLYCLTRAMESFFTCIVDAGYLPKSMNLKRVDVKGLNPSRGAVADADNSLRSWLWFLVLHRCAVIHVLSSY
ncbi:hypothetical protein V6N12_000145 [Hibiscus sabdariffa]|uniref:Uncharacterized protein n=1 Tax=Hibiscus sabdariffa TaxID=183260 RepID=A0ABR2B2Q0_9ROSI